MNLAKSSNHLRPEYQRRQELGKTLAAVLDEHLPRTVVGKMLGVSYTRIKTIEREALYKIYMALKQK